VGGAVAGSMPATELLLGADLCREADSNDPPAQQPGTVSGSTNVRFGWN